MLNNRRNENFDALKGYLIVLVIIGHTLLGSYYENPARKFIYFFHIPIFLATTGYFLKSHLLNSSPSQMLKKYWNRMLVPYFIALIIFTFLDYSLNEVNFTIRSIAHCILHPFYHLWYIPAIVIFSFYTKILDNYSKFFIVLLLFFLLLTITYETIGGEYFKQFYYLKLIGDLRFYVFYSYFFLGYTLASKNSFDVKAETAALLIPILLISYCFSTFEWLKGLSKVLSNVCIILFVFKICENLNTLKYNIISSIGKCSLPIYLWHVLPLFLLKIAYPQGGTIYYSLAVFLNTLLIICTLKLNGKYEILNRYFYGVKYSTTK